MQRPVIIGKGMIGSAFALCESERPLVIHAAGVSRSQEIRDDEFARDRDLLLRTIAAYKSLFFVYISSTSAEYQSTKYAQHKLQLEQFVRDNVANHLIVRLPQVVGVVQNSTMISQFVRLCLDGEVAKIESRARRNIIGVNDAVQNICNAVQCMAGGATANLMAPRNMSVEEVYITVANSIHVRPCYRLVPQGVVDKAVCDPLFSNLPAYEKMKSPNYSKKVIEYYAKKIKENFF